MSSRRIYGAGLVAGLSVREMKRMTPGFIMDMFKSRQEYDFAIHGIKIQKQGGEWD